MGVSSFEEALERKKGLACIMCEEHHPSLTKCNRSALLTKISKLMMANSGIPDLLSQKKEAVEIAQGFQGMLKKADEAHTILMQILSGYGDTGKEISKRYLEGLNIWVQDKEPTKQDTCGQLNLFDQ